MNAIEINALSKNYQGKIQALTNLSFSVPKAHIFGLLGPNGAGKTTLIKSLLRIISVSSGSAKILGKDFRDTSIRKQIGYLPENHKYPLFLTGNEVLFYFGSLSGRGTSEIRSEIPKLLKLVSMEKWAETKIKKYSKGMMQRIGLAQSLIGNPELIFLDEPTDGIDPVGRREIHDILRKLKAEGKTIFINSHMLAEIESVCDSVAILKQGKLIKYGSVEEITTVKEKYILEIDYPESALFDFLNETEFNCFKESENKYAFTIENVEQLNKLIDLLRSKEAQIMGIYPVKNSLEDSFISMLKK